MTTAAEVVWNKSNSVWNVQIAKNMFYARRCENEGDPSGTERTRDSFSLGRMYGWFRHRHLLVMNEVFDSTLAHGTCFITEN